MHDKRFPTHALVLLFIGAQWGCGSQTPATPIDAPPPPPGTGDAMPSGGAADQAPRKPAGKQYSDVITAEAMSDDGVFKVHMVGEKLYYEIPDSLFGRDMYMISRTAKIPNSSFTGSGNSVAEQLIQWERREKQIFIRSVSYANVADSTLPIFKSVSDNNYPSILAAFPIETTSDDDSPVIEVTRLFTSDMRAISPVPSFRRGALSLQGLDRQRSYINSARSYPLNVEVRHTLTFNSGSGSLTFEMNQSMILLPKEPMRVRYADPRVGWFTTQRTNFGLDEQKAATQTVINRWRLEPKDPEAYARGELVEPVKPIIYYVDPATPDKWAPYVKQGIEDWQSAFEAAGFKNAIIGKYAPTPEEDPEFNPEDVRYSTVRWVASMTRNAMGPSVVDPRSGEIFEADIIWWHNHLRSYRNRLLIETGAANPKAQGIPLPDEHLGEAVRQVIAHEVGHTLGLPHNMGASWAYPVDSLRSPTFTDEYGVAASVMEYARQNYVAQPGDGVRRFIRKIGPYDLYSVSWGYRVIPDAATPEDEAEMLDRWIVEKADDPMYRFGVGFGDPRNQTEDLGDDAVKASGYAIANLKRVVPKLIEWTTRPGEDYSDLSELYGELIQQWSRYIGHVAGVIGGVYTDAKTADQPGVVYRFVGERKQRDAIRFLNEHLFQTPTFLLDREILSRIEGQGALARIRSAQSRFLGSVLSSGRLQTLIESEVHQPDDSYSVMELFADLKGGIWSELSSGNPKIDVYRRNLQRLYVDRMSSLLGQPAGGGGPALPGGIVIPGLGGGSANSSDVAALTRGHLTELQNEIYAAASKASDSVTKYHLIDLSVRLAELLDLEVNRAGPVTFFGILE